MRFVEFVKRSSLSEWCLVAVTCALTVIAYVHRHALQVDERAWVLSCGRDCIEPNDVNRSVFAERVQSGHPITYQLYVKNVGKTPARNITVDIFVALIPHSEPPPVTSMEHPESHLHERLTSGVLFPGAVLKPLVPIISGDGSALLASDDQVTALRNGSVYLATFGILRYEDVFGHRHFTRFCTWDTAEPTIDSSRFNLKGCEGENDAN